MKEGSGEVPDPRLCDLSLFNTQVILQTDRLRLHVVRAEEVGRTFRCAEVQSTLGMVFVQGEYNLPGTVVADGEVAIRHVIPPVKCSAG